MRALKMVFKTATLCFIATEKNPTTLKNRKIFKRVELKKNCQPGPGRSGLVGRDALLDLAKCV